MPEGIHPAVCADPVQPVSFDTQETGGFFGRERQDRSEVGHQHAEQVQALRADGLHLRFLARDLPADKRAQFANTIVKETDRLNAFAGQLLQLAALEKRQRIDNPGPAWQMPQGGVDKGESPRDAALRELWEETGVPADLVTVEAETAGWVTYDLPHDLVPKVWKGRYRGQKQKWFLLRLTGAEDRVRMDLTGKPEFDGWRWVSYWYPLGQVVTFKREVYRRALKELAPRLLARD